MQIDPSRPMHVFSVDAAIGGPVPVYCQEGTSGRIFARTVKPYPCPGNRPEYVWGHGDTEHEAVHEVSAAIGMLNNMGCWPGQWDWRIFT